MNQSKLDQEMEELLSRKKNEEVPAFFSQGIDEALASLPSTVQTERKRGKKRGWMQVAAVSGVLAAGIIASSMGSPAMAAVLKKVPVLSYIYSVTYKEVDEETQPPHTISGSQYGFGEKGPFNAGEPEVKSFDGYTKELKEYIGIQIPELKTEEGHLSIRVAKYNEGQFDIHAFNEDGVLNVVTDPANLPSFEGASVHSVVKESKTLHGVKAEVLSYQFSKTDESNRTNYVVWKRDRLLLILASTLKADELVKKAEAIDRQLLEIKENQ
ncbi:hypothetical protein AC623_01700 [Bacillus sp. FJAT-27231]|uniref:hypothetical protein n=1 Tax=Bacillus sp. FJAT-27231 TaxID=1679168 RepID=UPI0006710EC2|nr:hypothetical protein [Bacillus sp. FJAT-27231]KMY52854.1 hypothetical protein AC623_01700 [Bacillus sp. FJAT-27231]